MVEVPQGRRYVYGSDPVRLLPDVPRAIRSLNTRSITVVVATNQQGVALREYPEMTLRSVEKFNARMNAELGARGAHIDKFYVCPHGDAEACPCRKPKPGLILQALKDYGVSPGDAVAIGNNDRDVRAARSAGVRAFLVPYPPGTPIKEDVPYFGSLLQAVRAALSRPGANGRPGTT